MFTFKPGTLIVIGVFAIVVGLMPPVGILCVVSGVACVGFGINDLVQESKRENKDE